jgi:hypothetical protein
VETIVVGAVVVINGSGVVNAIGGGHLLHVVLGGHGGRAARAGVIHTLK